MNASHHSEQILAERQRSQRVVQTTLGVMALASLAFGLGLYALAGAIGIPLETARMLATAFLLASIVDAAALYLWDRIFR